MMHNQSYIFRPSAQTDFDSIMVLIEEAKEFLKESGSSQWQDGHPKMSTIQSDILASQSYVLIQDTMILGVATLCDEKESSYEMIEGQWACENDYLAIHRFAISKKHRGKGLSHVLMTKLIEEAFSRGYRYLRIDTHEQNTRMQAVIEQAGFKYRGIVHVEDQLDSKRLAYDLIL